MLKRILLIITSAVLFAGFSGCKGNKTPDGPGNDNQEELVLLQFTDMEPGEEYAVMHTSMGDIKLRFFPEQAPKAVDNFITHAKNGYYNGLKFHRVMENFMIQGGDPEGTGTGGESIFGGEFDDEFSFQLYNFRGSLSMANHGPNTNSSQFFIVQAKDIKPFSKQDLTDNGWPEKAADKYVEIGGYPTLDQRHTVFGFVFEGMDVVDAIAAVEKDPEILDRSGEPYVPLEDVIIESIEFFKF